jgi:ParB-like chromosome segregation protein Spo0J
MNAKEETRENYAANSRVPVEDEGAWDISPALDRRTRKEADKSDDLVDQPVPEPPSSEEVENETGTKSVRPSETTDYQAHPLADLFPMMLSNELDKLTASVKIHGLQEAIMLCDGKILDGRNRYKACVAANVEPVFKDYEDDNALGYVMLKNLHRRQLKTSHRAVVAATLTNLKQGQRADTSNEVSAITIKQAAEILNVGRASVERARFVLDSGNSELIDAVTRGHMTVSAAIKELQEPGETDAELSMSERQCKRLQKLWSKTEVGGRAMFLDAIEASQGTDSPSDRSGGAS